MTRKQSGLVNAEPQRPAKLLIPKTKAIEQLEECIKRGERLISQPINSASDFREVRNSKYSWIDYNKDFLERIFDNSRYSIDYHGATHEMLSLSYTDGPQSVELEHEGIKRGTDFLQSLIERLDFIEEIPQLQTRQSEASKISQTATDHSSIFVVHGHDNSVRLNVTRFLEKLGLNPIVLHEQANAGRTIIEKFEAHSDVQFAVILLTPDDVGAVTNDQVSSSPRARQNVIFEWGYFVAKLGRRNVFALNKSVEIPSDMSGILYEPYDDADGWHLKLAREMKVAGLEVDLNKIF